jgi:hypothetical protein
MDMSLDILQQLFVGEVMIEVNIEVEGNQLKCVWHLSKDTTQDEVIRMLYKLKEIETELFLKLVKVDDSKK